MKADDDIYLRPGFFDFLPHCFHISFIGLEILFDFLLLLISDRLSVLLAKERSHPLTYLGCMKKGPVFTDPKLKWLVLVYILNAKMVSTTVPAVSIILFHSVQSLAVTVFDYR